MVKCCRFVYVEYRFHNVWCNGGERGHLPSFTCVMLCWRTWIKTLVIKKFKSIKKWLWLRSKFAITVWFDMKNNIQGPQWSWIVIWGHTKPSYNIHFFVAMDRVIHVWGGDMDYGVFWSFGLPMILGQIMYTILSLTSRSLNSMYHICLSWIRGMHSLTHRICWDSVDQWWFSHDQEVFALTQKLPRSGDPIYSIKFDSIDCFWATISDISANYNTPICSNQLLSA